MSAHFGSRLAIASRFVPPPPGPSYGPEICADPDLGSSTGWALGGSATIAGGQLLLGATSGSARYTWPEPSNSGDVVQLRITLASLGTDAPVIRAGNNYIGFGIDLADTGLIAGLNTFQYTVGAGSPQPCLQIYGQVNGTGSVIESVSIRRVL